MTTLTVNLDDKKSEKAVKDFLDSLGLIYSINSADWWQNKDLVNELDKRSRDLKSGKDEGVSYSQIKNNLLKP